MIKKTRIYIFLLLLCTSSSILSAAVNIHTNILALAFGIKNIGIEYATAKYPKTHYAIEYYIWETRDSFLDDTDILKAGIMVKKFSSSIESLITKTLTNTTSLQAPKNSDKIRIFIGVGLSYIKSKNYYNKSSVEYKSELVLDTRIGLKLQLSKYIFTYATWGFGYSPTVDAMNIAGPLNETLGIKIGLTIPTIK